MADLSYQQSSSSSLLLFLLVLLAGALLVAQLHPLLLLQGHLLAGGVLDLVDLVAGGVEVVPHHLVDLPQFDGIGVAVEVVGEHVPADGGRPWGAHYLVGGVVVDVEQGAEVELLPLAHQLPHGPPHHLVHLHPQLHHFEAGPVLRVLRGQPRLDRHQLRVLRIVEHQFPLHLLRPAGVLLPPAALVLVGDAPLAQLAHDGLVQVQRHLHLRVLGAELVGEPDEAVEVLGLDVGHPVPAVDEGRLDHLELLPPDDLQLGVEVLRDEPLQLAVGQPHYRRDDVVVPVGSAVIANQYIVYPRYYRAVGQPQPFRQNSLAIYLSSQNRGSDSLSSNFRAYSICIRRFQSSGSSSWQKSSSPSRKHGLCSLTRLLCSNSITLAMSQEGRRSLVIMMISHSSFSVGSRNTRASCEVALFRSIDRSIPSSSLMAGAMASSFQEGSCTSLSSATSIGLSMFFSKASKTIEARFGLEDPQLSA